jgi:hypothetical protein
VLFSPPYKFSDACRGHWETAERLFKQLQEDDVDFDVVTFNSLLSAYMTGDKADMVRLQWDPLSLFSGNIYSDIFISHDKVFKSMEESERRYEP